MNDHPHRKTVRLPSYDYGTAGAYFVTICAHEAACRFGEIVEGEMRRNELGDLVEDDWRAIVSHFEYVSLDQFVVMPNHVHGIIFLRNRLDTASRVHEVGLPSRDTTSCVTTSAQTVRRFGEMTPGSLPTIVRAFKAGVTNKARNALGIREKIWQPGYYEHVIRDDADLAKIREYIANNPMKWELDKENSKTP